MSSARTSHFNMMTANVTAFSGEGRTAIFNRHTSSSVTCTKWCRTNQEPWLSSPVLDIYNIFISILRAYSVSPIIAYCPRITITKSITFSIQEAWHLFLIMNTTITWFSLLIFISGDSGLIISYGAEVYQPVHTNVELTSSNLTSASYPFHFIVCHLPPFPYITH
jgi:hypothetical protein